ncbi:ATPase AAA [Fibrobacterales bacterium]|nr:ATPase AAA [Fibrobacterales bacterium]
MPASKTLTKLPIGIQTFADLRENGYLYVDKTEYIYRLVSLGKSFFLSRPRRFGKSLLVSTMQALFLGKKELFKGLWIAKHWDFKQKFPVIKLDWSAVRRTSPEDAEPSLQGFLKRIATDYKIKLTEKTAADQFGELLESIHKKTGKQVVLLIDEYDMPILDNLETPQAEPMRDYLQNFYKIIKSSDEHLRFIFLTGVTRFSKVALFSGLNSPLDITIDNRFSTICGYTQDELEKNFKQHIKVIAEEGGVSVATALERIKFWYNGFSWDGINPVYNPYSTLILFTQKMFRGYWFSSGSPTFLIEQIKKRNDVALVLEPVTLTLSNSDNFNIAHIDTAQLMFQTGYLSIKSVQKNAFGTTDTYTLGVSNEEVRVALIEYLTGLYANAQISNTLALREQMTTALQNGDASSLEIFMRKMFADIPYKLYQKKEAYYHSLFLLWLNLLGFKVQGEVNTNLGSIDAVWELGKQVIVAELKYSTKLKAKTLLKNAMAQIKKNRYYEKYEKGSKTVSLLGIGFSGKEKDLACKIL